LIEGVVTPYREATIVVTLEWSGGQEEIEAVVDTGFNGSLTLPLDVVDRLSLPIQAETKVTLAEGTETSLKVVETTLLWEGAPRIVAALEAQGSPLIRMSLLYGYRLTMEVVDGGSVRIEMMS
jgi:clan AA aspartic protease